MTTLREAWARLVSFFRKRDLDREFDEEIAAHVELGTQDYLRQGLSFSEARRQALIKLGGIEPSRQRHRESRGLPWLDGIVQDLRYAIRGLRRSPGFAITAIATLAIGIGINVTVFTVTNATIFKGLPFVDRNDRILYINSREHNGEVSYPDFQDWRAQAKSFEGMAAVKAVGVSLADTSSAPENYDATEISADAFKLIGQRPFMGRDFSDADEIPGATPVTILSYGLWERRYGKDPSILGRTIQINRIPTTVIGIMPKGFVFPYWEDLWILLAPNPELHKRENRNLMFVFGRMAEGATIESARAEMEIIGRRLASTYPLTNQDDLPVVENFNEHFLGRNATMMYESMWGAVCFVLLIACANLANLALARALGRSREISLRIALGAGRRRIIQQLLVESVMLSATGGVLGWWFAKWGVRSYELAAASLPRSFGIDYTMDHRVLAYLIAISITTGILFGLAPASRLSKLDVNSALKDGIRGSLSGAGGGTRGTRLCGLLVAGEMALAVVPLAGAGLMIRSFLYIYTADVGVKPANVLLTSVVLPDDKYSRAEAKIFFYDHLIARLKAIPGVESIAIANRIPTNNGLTFPYELTDMAASGKYGQRRPTLSAIVIGPAYFQTLGASVLSGRDFNDTDRASAIPVVLVNQRFAAQCWPGEEPIGKHLRLFHGNTPEPWLRVVGVVSNIVQNDRTGQEFGPLVYLPYSQKPQAVMNVFARTRVPPTSLAPAFQHEIRAMDSDLTIYDFLTLTERLDWNYRSSGLSGVLFLIAAVIALLLASIGLYAVIAHSVRQRTQEIGIRMAMGATARDILRLVFRQGMLPLGIGLAVGLAGSLAANNVLKANLVQVPPSDPLTIVIACTVLVSSAILGCLIPARRAMRVDPAVALRNE